MPPAPQPPEYVLGTDRAELERLALQHRLWADAAHALWRLAGVKPGATVLDLGSGPGYAALDLAELVGPTGHVLALDESPRFLAHLRAQAAARAHANITAVEADARHAAAALTGLPHAPEVVYARWVFCFLPDPEATVRSLAALLPTGGRLAVHDYFNYETMSAAPRRGSYAKVVHATGRSWRARGGDPDIMGRLPAMLEAHGFAVPHLTIHARTARPGEQMWHWTDSWWRNYVPRLVEMGELTPADAERFFTDCADIAATPGHYIVCPPVYELLAVKR